MPILKNPRHERFAQEIAAGKSQADAYVAAGYRANTGNASTLKADQSVSKRVSEIAAERLAMAAVATKMALNELSITRADVLQMLLDDRAAAHQLGQIASAVRCAELLGKEHGMFIDRKHTTHRFEDDPTRLTDAELLDIARQGRDGVAEAPGSAEGSRKLH